MGHVGSTRRASSRWWEPAIGGECWPHPLWGEDTLARKWECWQSFG